MAAFEVMGLELNRALSEYVQEELGIETYQGLITDPEVRSLAFVPTKQSGQPVIIRHGRCSGTAGSSP